MCNCINQHKISCLIEDYALTVMLLLLYNTSVSFINTASESRPSSKNVNQLMGLYI